MSGAVWMFGRNCWVWPDRRVSAQFGDSQKLRLVRILRSTVMVRVGGGWEALDEFLVKNDPCRGESGIPSPESGPSRAGPVTGNRTEL